MILDNKEKEFVKKRNSDLFKIKVYEKQLYDLQKALSALEIMALNQGEEQINKIKNQIESNKDQTEKE